MQESDLPRLLLWAVAFQDWLAERAQRFGKDALKQARLAWGRFLAHLPIPPWRLTPADLEAHAAWMLAQGYSPNTAYAAQGYLIAFLDWACARRVDPACSPGFNPAAGVRRLVVPRYHRAALLTPAKVNALLALAARDPTPVGRRDHAFLLCRLRLGVPLQALRTLRWGQIEHAVVPDGAPTSIGTGTGVITGTVVPDGIAGTGVTTGTVVPDGVPASGAWVRWDTDARWEADGTRSLGPHRDGASYPPGGAYPAGRDYPEGRPRQPFPADAWAALHAALLAGDRLAAIQPDHYLFAPLAVPGLLDAGSRAQDWLPDRPVSASRLLAALKIYGRAAGLPERKLTLQALRRTAARLHLDRGATPSEMQAFLASREDLRLTKYRLSRLPRLQPENAPPDPTFQPSTHQLSTLQPETLQPSTLQPSTFQPSTLYPSGYAEPGRFAVPARTARPFLPGENLVHGLYAQLLPPEQLQAVLLETPQGLEEQIVGLRRLERSLMLRLNACSDRTQAGCLMEAYSLAAFRQGELLKAEQAMNAAGSAGGPADSGPAAGGRAHPQTPGKDEAEWVESMLSIMDNVSIELGNEPPSEKFRAEVLGSDAAGAAALAEDARSLQEEIAGLRLILRNLYQLALDARDAAEHIRFVDLYGSTALRLAKMFKTQRSETSLLAEALRDMIDEVLHDIAAELDAYASQSEE